MSRYIILSIFNVKFQIEADSDTTRIDKFFKPQNGAILLERLIIHICQQCLFKDWLPIFEVPMFECTYPFNHPYGHFRQYSLALW